MKSADRNDLAGNDPLKVNAPPEVFQRRLQLRGLLVPLLVLLSCVLLTVSFVGWWVHLPYLAYFALVPWGLALGGAVSRRWAILWAWLGGVIFWAINLYWLWWITLPGYVAGVLYLSVYWLVAAIILRGASGRSWPMWICLPIVWVALEFIRGQMPVLGFPWFFLAHSQYCRPWLIQISDATGQYGVSVIVALANGVIIDLLALPLFGRQGDRKARILRRGPCGVVVFAVSLAGMLAYGWYRCEKQSGSLSQGPSIAVVQQAFPLSLYVPQTPPEKIFDEHVRSSEKFIDSGCRLLVWSESMTPAGMNPEWMKRMRKGDKLENLKQYHARIADQQKYKGRIVDLLGKLKCPLLTGSLAVRYNLEEGQNEAVITLRNSALLFDQTGKVVDQYAKRQLVPFSEYVPFKDGWPWLHGVLRGAVPAAMPQLEPGEKWTRFELDGESRQWILASPICFEGTFPSVCRNMVIDKGEKVVDILINLSNDGWFVWKHGDRPYRDSSEHAQHLVQYYFRAVENRVPVVRCVNTGISASIDSNGREVARITRHGATMVPGAMLLGAADSEDSIPAEKRGYQIGPRVLVDSRQSLYSTVGDVFAWMLVAFAIALTGVLWRRRMVEKKG
ncbi:MAG: apolipoprotein N-acyltransferase [Phycisphaerae bacterium]|nr:apolipoprotein N-acyltransferase [Phycisphaerae bacterium]